MNQNSPKIPFLKTILCLVMVYLLGHVSPILSVASNSIFSNLSFQSLAFAQDEDDEDEESSLYEGNTSLDRVESAISEGDEEEFDLLGGEGNSWSEDEDAAPDPDSGAYDGVCLR